MINTNAKAKVNLGPIKEYNEQLREAVVERAQAWKGTRYQHQAAVLGAGCDCAGLIIGVGRDLELLDMSGWDEFCNYSHQPNPRKMFRGLSAFLTQIVGHEEVDSVGHFTEVPASVRIGDVAWIQWRKELPMHLGILGKHPTGGFSLIHAYADVGKVVEHTLTEDWVKQIHSFWSYNTLAVR